MESAGSVLQLLIPLWDDGYGKPVCFSQAGLTEPNPYTQDELKPLLFRLNIPLSNPALQTCNLISSARGTLLSLMGL